MAIGRGTRQPESRRGSDPRSGRTRSRDRTGGRARHCASARRRPPATPRGCLARLATLAHLPDLRVRDAHAPQRVGHPLDRLGRARRRATAMAAGLRLRDRHAVERFEAGVVRLLRTPELDLRRDRTTRAPGPFSRRRLSSRSRRCGSSRSRRRRSDTSGSRPPPRARSSAAAGCRSTRVTTPSRTPIACCRSGLTCTAPCGERGSRGVSAR